VFPTRYEGSPKALLEAMACGLPVVATAAPGVVEIVEHNGNGLLADDGSPEALRAAIEEVVRDGALRWTLGVAARQTVVDFFDMNALIEKEVAIYEELLGA